MNNSKNGRQKRRWRIPLIILLILGLGVTAAGAAIWWVQRPVTATILSAAEITHLEQKVSHIQQTSEDPTYTPGEKEIVITQRELNGLLHENTPLGDQLKLELRKDAIHARISADIPEDFPLMAGKKLKGKARFLIKDPNGSPALILEDLTLWGISLPNDWLGNLKGENLLESVLSPENGSLAGVEEISVEKRSLIIRLAD